MKQELLTHLLQALRRWYDVVCDYEFCGHVFAGYAEYHAHAERYVVLKRAKLWEADTHQYLFFETTHELDVVRLDELIRFMKTRGLEKVERGPNHMSSDVGLVIVSDSIAPEVFDAVRRTRFRKNYKLGLGGWSDLLLVAVDISQRRVVANRQARKLGHSIEKQLFTDGREARHERTICTAH